MCSIDLHMVIFFCQAFNEETLKKVDTFKYNQLYNNWMDPQILKAFTIGKGAPRKPWKSAYGFPYVKRISWDGATLNSWDSSPCHLKCAAMVSQKRILKLPLPLRNSFPVNSFTILGNVQICQIMQENGWILQMLCHSMDLKHI